jgi:hypothetical protein
MLVALADLHKALAGGSAPEQVVQWLVEISGLSLDSLQNLYGKKRDIVSNHSSTISAEQADDLHLPTSLELDPDARQGASKTASER